MCRWKVIVFPHSDGKRADSYTAKLARIATVRVKSCGVVVRALSGAVWFLHWPLLPLPSGTCRHLGWEAYQWLHHFTRRLWEVRYLDYMCKSVQRTRSIRNVDMSSTITNYPDTSEVLKMSRDNKKWHTNILQWITVSSLALNGEHRWQQQVLEHISKLDNNGTQGNSQKWH